MLCNDRVFLQKGIDRMKKFILLVFILKFLFGHIAWADEPLRTITQTGHNFYSDHVRQVVGETSIYTLEEEYGTFKRQLRKTVSSRTTTGSYSVCY